MQTLKIVSFSAPFLFALAVNPASAFAQTTVPGGNLINQTWTQANSPYIVQGDLTVPAGSTFTIEAGVEVRFDPGDQQASGQNTELSEFTVHGTLAVNGTADAPVSFASNGAPDHSTWYGILIEPDASATIAHATLKDAFLGIQSDAPTTFSLTRSELSNIQFYGVHIKEGSAELDGVRVHDCTHGIKIDAETTSTLHNILAYDNLGHGVIVATSASSSDLSLTVHSSTFHNNGASGVSLACNGQGRATVEVYNSLATNNSNVGLESSKSPGTCRINASYSNAWGNGSGDLSRISARDGMLSANPQYVDAANGDFRLQPSSVAIDSGTDIGAPAHDIDGAARPFNGDGINGAEYDMGAYEFGATFAACGDGVVAQDEECDDGNLEDGDGCSSACVIEDDGGGDVGVDAGPDAGLDAGFDSGPDAAPDAGGRYDGEDEFIDDDIGEDQLDDAGHSNEDPADSGTPGKKGSEGCGCSATSGTPTPGSLALIALGAGLLFIRRRAASRKTPPMA